MRTIKLYAKFAKMCENNRLLGSTNGHEPILHITSHALAGREATKMAKQKTAQQGALRKKRAYRLEFDGWVLQGMVGLMALAGVAIFYLGYLTGQGTRKPVLPVLISQQQAPSPPAVNGNLLQPGRLSINQALSTPPTNEWIDSNGKRVQDTTQLLESARKLLSKNQSQTPPNALSQKKVPARALPAAPRGIRSNTLATAVPTSQNKPRPKPDQIPKNLASKGRTVAIPAAKSASAAFYTVQVFSSTQRGHAKNLATRLTKMKFHEVRLNQFQSSKGQVWHRVRVGRVKTRAQAQVLSNNLRQRTGLKNLQIIQP